MKKSILLLLLITLLSAITYFVVNKKNKLNANEDISIKDTDKIQKILIVDMKGNKVVISKCNNYWSLNDSLIARKDAVENILKVLKNIEAIQPVPNAAHNMVVNQLSALGTKVDAYDNNNKTLTSFTIGGPAEGNNGNFAYKANTENPFIYHLIGFEGDFSQSFFTDVSDWRDRQILNYNSDSIACIAINYYSFKDSNFHINNKNNELEIAYDNNKPLIYSRLKVKEYLKEFNSKYCLKYETKMKGLDSIKYNGYPYGFVAIQTKNGKQDTLHLVRMKANQRANEVKVINGVYFDQEYLFAYNKKDLMVIPTNTFSKILVVPSSFR